MNLFSKLSKTKVAKIMAGALILALSISAMGYALAATDGTGEHTVVVRAFDGDPINNVRVSGVTVTLVADSPRANPSHGLQAVTDGNGVATFTQVNTGGYNVEFRKGGFDGQDYHVMVDQSIQVDATLHSLAPASHKVVVRVFDGDPINNVRIAGAHVYFDADDDASNPEGDTNANGVATFEGVRHGAYNVIVSKTGYNSQAYHVNIDQDIQIDATLINLVTPPAPTPTPPPTGECTPTPPRGQPLLNIWPISETGANCTDYSLLAAKNLTQNAGYSHAVSATSGETIQVRLYVHNGVLDFPENEAKNVMVKANLPAASGTMTAEAWANNATKITSAQKGGNVQITLGNNQYLEFVPGSVKVYSRGPVLLGAGSDTVVGSGMSLGDMRGCFPFLRFVTFEVRVKTQTVTPPPPVNPPPVTPPPVVPPPAPQPSINMDKTVRNVTQGNNSFAKEVSANQGDQVEFQINVTATNTVNNIVVSDVLPAKLTYVTNSLRTDGIDAGNNLSAINLGNRSNMTVRITFRANVGSDFSTGRTELVNVANVTSSAGNQSSTAKVVVQITNPTQSLSINKQVRNFTTNESFREVTTASVNQTVEFRIEIRNNSSVTANNVRAWDVLPGQLTLIGNSFRVDGNLVNVGNFFGSGYGLGNMTAGQSHVITFQENTAASITVGATLVNTAYTTADNTGTISDTATVTLAPVLGGRVELQLSKRAYNVTQKIDATKKAAQPGDVIQYFLTVKNIGTETSPAFVIQDNISDVLQLADLTDYTGATLDAASNLKYPALDIAPGATVEKLFIVKIKAAIPSGTDFVMTNVYGNTISVPVYKYTAPPTGSTTTLSLILGSLVAAGTVAYRKYRFVLTAKFLNLN